LPHHYASADAETLQDRAWVENQWAIGRLRARDHEHGALLVLDEVQKVTAWSEVIKRLWDEDSAAGLVNAGLEVFYWRDRGLEVDYVVRRGRAVAAFEVKSGWSKGTHTGLDAFRRAVHPAHALLIGWNGIPLKEFFDRPVTGWFG